MRYFVRSWRDIVGCALIAGYMLFAAHIMMSWKAEAAASTALPVATAQNQMHFPHVGDTPDPNAILATVNQVRATQNLSPLVADSILSNIAQRRLDDMVQRQYYAHQDPNGFHYTDLLAGLQLKPDHSCENLDLTTQTQEQGVVTDWLISTHGHRECLLNPNDTRAGYATAVLTTIDQNSKPTNTYIVVAISSSDL